MPFIRECFGFFVVCFPSSLSSVSVICVLGLHLQSLSPSCSLSVSVSISLELFGSNIYMRSRNLRGAVDLSFVLTTFRQTTQTEQQMTTTVKCTKLTLRSHALAKGRLNNNSNNKVNCVHCKKFSDFPLDEFETK